ncbi:cytochrome c-type protein NapC [Enterovibrio coralii]|uniref:Cytochrome c-type protein n=1 Tax=Enterovibrio coralii TaxID=294935 RepID=A0A135I656_9GAMM|nr:cytochrome c-type protein NapC [Enterovibrio coralii]KXF80936.1 cytochrome C [Enterovibrio coralii]
MKIPNVIKRAWKWFRTPSHFAIGTVLIVGFAGGIIFWGGFHTGMEMTNQEGFCIGCHEMRDNVYEEYVGTIHYTNRSGVRATCPDCHVPKEWGPKMVRKIQASKELYAKAFGIVDTPQKFEDHRLEMATREWTRMKANDSQECRNCHNFEYMDFSTQKTVAASVHDKAEEAGQTCIDCHKGIAHKLPKNFDASKEFKF